jgi:hypothetical protein
VIQGSCRRVGFAFIHRHIAVDVIAALSFLVFVKVDIVLLDVDDGLAK